jgi:tetratricopeptide (TPR) repeat protein
VADFFGSANILIDKKGKITIEPGQLQTDRVLTVQKAIEDKNDTKLKDLFFIDRNAFDGFQYAHAWSFVYFLNEYDKGKYQKGFQKFFKDLYTVKKGIPYESVPAAGPTGRGKQVSPEDIRDLLLKAIRVKDVEDLEKQWKEFVKAIPIEGRDARLKRGLRSVMMGDFKDAVEDLDVAIELGAEDPRAWASRGRAKALTSGPKSGIKDLETAVEKDPLNAAFRNELSGLLVGSISTGFFRASGGGDKLFTNEEAKKQAGLAVELDPENEAYKSWYQRFE